MEAVSTVTSWQTSIIYRTANTGSLHGKRRIHRRRIVPNPNAGLNVSSSLLNFLAQEGCEGFRDIAYQDQGGIWTLGVGHTGGVKQGDVCTRQQAIAWLEGDLKSAADAVIEAVQIEAMLQREFDAFTSLAFNIGNMAFTTKFSGLGLFEAGYKQDCADRFLRWDMVGKVVSAGLVNRRNAERAMFLGISTNSDGTPNNLIAAYQN
jgi:lysozyme